MPFNGELEDFAQAFSSGYGMVKSKEEKQAEALNLQLNQEQLKHAQFENTQAPITAAQQAEEHGLTVEGLKGDLTDKQAARERLVETNKQQDAATKLALADAEQLLATHKRANDPDTVALEKSVNNLKLRQQQAETAKAEFDANPDNMAATANLQRAQIASENALTEWRNQQTAGQKLTNAGLERDDIIQRNVLGGLPTEPPALPPEFQPHAVDDGTTPAPAPDIGAPRAAAITAPTPEAVNASDAVSSIFNDPNGARKPVGDLTQVPDDSVAATAVDTGVRKPVDGLAQVPDDSTASKKQQLLDHMASGGGNDMPNGQKAIVVAGREATKDGLNSLMQAHGLHDNQAVNTPETEQQARDFLGGTRAASADTATMVKDTIEEKAGEKLSENQKNFYALGTGWLYYNRSGQPEKAKKYAESLLGHYQQVFAQYTAVAKAAVAGGDIDGAMEATVRAYANVPTGDELHLSWTKDKKHIVATMKDMNGKVTEKQLMTPEEMGAFVMNVDPSSFVTLISQAAGKEDNTISQAAAEKMGMPDVAGLTPEEVRIKQGAEAEKSKAAADKSKEERDRAAANRTATTERDTQITDAIGQYVQDNPTHKVLFEGEGPRTFSTPGELLQGGVPSLKHNYSTDIKNTATDIFNSSDNSVTPNEAVEASVRMIGARPDHIKLLDDKTMEIGMDGLPPITMSRERYRTLSVIRNTLHADADKLAEKDQKSADELRSFLDSIGKFVGGASEPGTPASNQYAVQPTPPYDPNRADPTVEAAKKIWQGTTAVPAGPVPAYNPSGRPGYDQPMNRP